MALSGAQKTRIGGTNPWHAYAGFSAKEEGDIWAIQAQDSTSWSDQSPDATVWSVQTPDNTTWTEV